MDNTTPEPEQFVFLLLEKFSMIAFAAAIEPLRIANRMSGKPLYAWKLASADGGPVTCSNTATVNVDMGLEPVTRDQRIVVCSGIDVRENTPKPVLAWLRRESRRGMDVGAICTGTHVLAKAGLLDTKACTIHWENRDSFMEEFSNILQRQVNFPAAPQTPDAAKGGD